MTRRTTGHARGRASGRRWPGAAAVVAALALAAPLLANGGTLRVADAPVGAYRVSIYTDPTPPRPDSLDVSVLVVRPGDQRPVPDLAIEVRARPETGPTGPDSARVHVVPATRDQADDPRYYAAKFAPGAEGRWHVVVAVAGPEGRGEVTFSLDVREPGPLENPWVVVVVALLPLGVAAWWLTRGREEER